MVNSKIYKLVSLILIAVMFMQQTGFAQIALKAPTQAISANNSVVVEKFRQAHLRYFSFDANKDSFNLFMDKADMKNISDIELQMQTQDAFKYFLTGIKLTNNKFWVNLKPDAADNIIDPVLEKTDIGRIFLASDVQLKKDLALMTSPNTPEGKEYWNKLYQKANEIFGADSKVNIPTLIRPWIVPGEVIMRGTGESAYIYKANLKVMLESDYLNNSNSFNFKDSRLKALNDYAAELVKQMFIPQLTKEVNNSKKYSDLRKVFYSLILAQYFKEEFKGNVKSSYSQMIDSNNLSSITSKTNWSKDEYFQAYQKSFKDGEYNIKESVNGNKIRMYVSGGIDLKGIIIESSIISTLRGIYRDLAAFERTLGMVLNSFVVGRSGAVVPLAVAVPMGTEVKTVTPRKSSQGKRVIIQNGGLIDDDSDGGIITMTDYQDMFRDYDYRYTGKKAFDSEVAYKLSLAWADMALEKAQKAGIDNRTVVVARDARKIETELVDKVIEGLRRKGLNVVYVAKDQSNAVTSYSWAVQELKPLMGIFLTASHVSRPKEEIVRGFKVQMVNKKGGRLLSLTTKEIKQVSKAIVKKYVDHPEVIGKDNTDKSSYQELDINKNCIRFNALVGRVAANGGSLYNLGESLREADAPVSELKRWESIVGDTTPLRGMKIVIDGAHTVSGYLAAETYKNLGADVTLINGDVWEIEGEHNADPSKGKNLEGLKAKISEIGAHFGMSFDLDGDRGAIVVPEEKEALAPDNLMTILLPYLMENLGYDAKKINKNVGVIRDVLGTYGVNDRAEQLGVKVFQTDAGYVFLKAKREDLLDKENYVIPIYGERSGHCWLDVSGEIENPLAVAVLFATAVKKAMFDAQNKAKSENPALDYFAANTIAYSQSPRFQPVFHPKLLEKLSSDSRNDLGWKYDSKTNANPPQAIIALGRDVGVAALKEFTQGRIFGTAAGLFRVKEFNSYKDSPEDGDLYRFADIVFEDLEGKFAGRFIFRASSNDPTFVCSYETPIRKGESKLVYETRKASIANLVLSWLQDSNYALVTVDAIEKNLGLSKDAAEKKAEDMNLLPVEQDMRLASKKNIINVEDGGADSQRKNNVVKNYIGKEVYKIAGEMEADNINKLLNAVDFKNMITVDGVTADDSILNLTILEIETDKLHEILDAPFGKDYAQKSFYRNWLAYNLVYSTSNLELGALPIFDTEALNSGNNHLIWQSIVGNFSNLITAAAMYTRIGELSKDSFISDDLLQAYIQVMAEVGEYEFKLSIEKLLPKIRSMFGTKNLGDLSLEDVVQADGGSVSVSRSGQNIFARELVEQDVLNLFYDQFQLLIKLVEAQEILEKDVSLFSNKELAQYLTDMVNPNWRINNHYSEMLNYLDKNASNYKLVGDLPIRSFLRSEKFFYDTDKLTVREYVNGFIPKGMTKEKLQKRTLMMTGLDKLFLEDIAKNVEDLVNRNSDFYRLKSNSMAVAQNLKTRLFYKKLGEVSLDDIARADGGKSKTDNFGGIDMTRIDILRQSLIGAARINFRLPEAAMLQNINLEVEKQQLMKLMNNNMVPSTSRIIKYLSASIVNKKDEQSVNTAYVYLTDYFKFAEDVGFDTDANLKSFVRFVEAGI